MKNYIYEVSHVLSVTRELKSPRPVTPFLVFGVYHTESNSIFTAKKGKGSFFCLYIYIFFLYHWRIDEVSRLCKPLEYNENLKKK